MAITIAQEPNKYETVYNEIVYVVDSDNKTYCKFKYIADVYVNGVKVFTDKLFPEPYNGYGVFKIGAILESYLSWTLDINQDVFMSGLNSIIEYYIEFGEEYDTSSNCDSSTTLFRALETSDTKYSWNGTYQYDSYTRRDYTDFTVGDSTKRFLTNMPNEVDIAMNEKYYLSYMLDDGITCKYMRVRTYDISGATYGVYYYQNYLSETATTYDTRFTSMGCGVINLNTYTPDVVDISYSTGAVINSNVYSYKIDLCNFVDGTNLLINPTFQYLGGSNYWIYDDEPGCDSSFGIEVTNKLVYRLPDASCRIDFSTSYTGGTFVQGNSYTVTFNVDNVNNPSSESQFVRVRLGGNYGSIHSGVGTFTDTIICGTSGVLALDGFFDADTGGYGAHSFSLDSISISSDDLTVLSETKTFNIDRCKSMFEPYRFVWLNQLGGFDQFTYKLAHTRKAVITRKEYSSVLGKTSVIEYGRGGWKYNIGDRGRRNTYIDAKDKFTCNSDWVYEKTVNWLEEIYESLEVYQVENIYYKTFWGTSNNSGLVGFHFSNNDFEFKVGDYVLTILENFNNNTTYNVVSYITDVIGNMIITDLSSDIYLGGGAVLVESGTIYLVSDVNTPNKYILPIIVTNAEFEEKQLVNNQKMINYTIDFERSYDKTLQRG